MDYRLTTLAVRLRAAGHSVERVGRLLGVPAAAVRDAVLGRLDVLRRQVEEERDRPRLWRPGE
jgi:predicted transcriptional regulator